MIATKIWDITDVTSKNGDSTSKHGDVIYVIPIGWLVGASPLHARHLTKLDPGRTQDLCLRTAAISLLRCVSLSGLCSTWHERPARG